MKPLIIITIGTRPEVVRFAPIIKELEKSNDVDVEVLHTGQHYSYNMSEVFFKDLNLKFPKYNLNVEETNPALQISKMIEKAADVIELVKPSVICVYGDTNSSLAVALAANKLKIKLVHVEAGCRSYDNRMPEEHNRLIIDSISDYLIAVSKTDYKNLKKRDLISSIYNLGDPLYTVFTDVRKMVHSKNILAKFGLIKAKYILATLHRAENVDIKSTLENILITLNSIKDFKVILPLHPRTRKLINQFKLEELVSNINIVEPIPYEDTVTLISNAACVITDSGGIQKEAFFAKTPCITLRLTTEHVDTVKLRANFLVDPSTNNCKQKVMSILSNIENIQTDIQNLKEKPFGDKKSPGLIAEVIIKAALI